jgi:predicted nucleic acid-binding protein
MTGPVFVDANVLLYAHSDEAARRSRARNWIDHLWSTGLGRTSTQVLSEFYVNLKRKEFGVAPEAAWQEVAVFLAWKPQGIDQELFTRARQVEQRFRISWWDSMVVAAAQVQNCAVLLTEDLHDGGAFGTLVVRSPFTLEIREPAAAYSVPPQLAGLHRPRGRPRRTALA